MYEIKFDAKTCDYLVLKNGKQVTEPFPTKPKAKEYISSLTTEKAIVKKTSVLLKTDVAATEKTTIDAPVEPKIDTTEVTTTEEPKTQPAATNKPKISLFSDNVIGVKTEEDDVNTQFVNEKDEEDDDDDDTPNNDIKDRITDVATNLAKDTNDKEDDAVVRRKMAQINAILLIEFLNIVFCFLCQFIAKDFSESSGEKYSLSKVKKEALRVPLQKILEMRKKAMNPILALVLAVLGSFAPLLIIAFADRRKAEREKTAQLDIEAKQEQARREIEAYKQDLMRQLDEKMNTIQTNPEITKRAEQILSEGKAELKRTVVETPQSTKIAETKTELLQKRKGRGRPKGSVNKAKVKNKR